MKFLVTMEWKPENYEKCWELYEKQMGTESEGVVEYILPGHHIRGKNKGFSVVDIKDMDKYTKALDKWAELIVFNLYPIIETAKLYELHKS